MAAWPGGVPLSLEFVKGILGPGRGQRSERCPLPREELQSVQRELEVLSEQYSQKCLENAHLAQALEAERQALRQCQRENQELNAHNQVSLTGPCSAGTTRCPASPGCGQKSPLLLAASLGLCFSSLCGWGPGLHPQGWDCV